METYIQALNRKEREIAAALSPVQTAVAKAMWGSIQSSDAINGPILDFGPSAQNFIEELAKQGYAIVERA